MTANGDKRMVRIHRRRAAVIIAIFGAAVSAVALRPRESGEPVVDRRFAVEMYAGNAACQDCHEHGAAFDQTPHARALMPVTVAEHGVRLIGKRGPEGTLEFIPWDSAIAARDAARPTVAPIRLEWCFGSGETAQTFVTLLADDDFSRVLEHRWSWFVAGAALDNTPGQPESIEESVGASAEQMRFGRLVGPGQTLQCFRCHSTAFTFRAGKIDAASLVPGVQCEACHGPRQAHVAAQWAGRAEPTRPPRSAREQVDSCGECHRRADQIDKGMALDHPMLARFQPIGFVNSKCFLATEAEGRLVCTTCHDPHAARRPTVDQHNDQCRKCHGPAALPGRVECKAMPIASNCVDCHMPKVTLHSRLQFTNHRIGADRRTLTSEKTN